MRDVIERIGHLNPDLVKPTKGPENLRYRNREMQMPVGGTKQHIKMGFYAMGSHDIVQGTSCLIQRDENNQIAQVCYDTVVHLSIELYNELTGGYIAPCYWPYW